MILKILMILFSVFALSRSYLRYKDGILTLGGALFWSSIWVLVTVAVFVKEWTSSISTLMGIGRGVDMLLFAAILFLSYLSFRLYVRLEETQHDLTKLIRALAIERGKAAVDAEGGPTVATEDDPA